jgi:hypothetical protein
VLCLAGRWAGKASTSRVGDPRARARARLGVGDAKAAGTTRGGSFATHFATVFNAATTALSAFA